MNKEEMLEKLNGSVGDFFSLLCEMRGASALNEKLVQLLVDIHDKDFYSVNAQKVLHIFFSLVNDGNTCISLNPKSLLAKWKKDKWDGLVLLASNEGYADEIQKNFPAAEDFMPIIEAGCNDLMAKKDHAPLCIVPIKKNGVEKPYLMAEKYLDAKGIIENCFDLRSERCVFDGKAAEADGSKDKEEEFESLTTKFTLEQEQKDAVLKGRNSNLIITGGPGTGKTTVIFFLLWDLLKNNEEMRKWSIHFAAPSGKAADRLRESLDDNIADLTDEAQKDPIVQHLKNVDDYTTLHRLLSYNPQTNGFRYCKSNPFPDNSIFVIDEASMIDLSMFASFMQALPKNKNAYRLYVLGDKDQLPSVEAGAVLGEILGLNKNSVVELTKSKRFDNNSKIGRLSRFIQQKLPESDLQFELKWTPWKNDLSLWKAGTDEVNLLQLKSEDGSLNRADEERMLHELLLAWINRFYAQEKGNLVQLASAIRSELTESNFAQFGLVKEDWEQECANREALWKLSDVARILSAERRGMRGIENLNREIIKSLGFKADVPFDGKMMILTKNQSYFDLYNGDSGIVVNCSTRPMLMLKRKGNFVFYPLSLLPSDSLEPAFAITIHKSQGSGYPNIMMFLPTRKGHPLLNRQILYTGVTRTKKQSLTIIATPETFKAACETVIERDTGIEIQ